MDKKAGRPRLPQGKVRDTPISTRLLPEENEAIIQAVKRSGETKSDWVRKVLLDAASLK
jgi:hypothetical protein